MPPKSVATPPTAIGVKDNPNATNEAPLSALPKEISLINSPLLFLWSKRFDLIKKFFDENKKPDNLILIYSNPKLNKPLEKLPKYFDKTFNNVLENENVDQQNCTGQKCKDCLACYKFDTTTTIVEKVKKY